MRKSAVLAAAAIVLFGSLAVGQQDKEMAPDLPATKPAAATIEITLDTKDAPECAAFAQRCKVAGEKYYPTISALLPQEGYTPAKKVTIVFKHMDGVAYTDAHGITCAAEYFTKHPDDVGAVIHELAHVVQRYTVGKRPGWLVEGIADWVRWFNYEPANKRPHPTQPRASYDASYQTTATFLEWCQTKYDKRLVAELDEACRKGHYTPGLWKEKTGKSVEDLGAEWKATLPRGKAAASRPAK